MAMPGATEWFIILIIVLVLFGGSRITGLGKSLGQGIKEFRDAMKNNDDTDKTTTPPPAAPKAE